jgi:hypothetical protein
MDPTPLVVRARTRLSLQKDAPDVRPIERLAMGKVVPIPEVCGLHHRYVRRAAESNLIRTGPPPTPPYAPALCFHPAATSPMLRSTALTTLHRTNHPSVSWRVGSVSRARSVGKRIGRGIAEGQDFRRFFAGIVAASIGGEGPSDLRRREVHGSVTETLDWTGLAREEAPEPRPIHHARIGASTLLVLSIGLL